MAPGVPLAQVLLPWIAAESAPDGAFGAAWGPGSWSLALPPASTILWLAPTLAAVLFGVGYLCGLLKLRFGVRTGETRKIQHFVAFAAAAVLQVTLGHPAVNVLGGVGTGYIAVLLLGGEGNVLYEGFARESDRPHRSLYVIIPLIGTTVGGVLATALFGPFAAVGFAVTGVGDAVGEPVGLRYGKHPYRVPGLGLGVRSRRTLEGSVAVLIGSMLAATVVLRWLGAEGTAVPSAHLATTAAVVGVAAAVAAVATVVESLSPHGIDNLTLQLAASWTAWGLAG